MEIVITIMGIWLILFAAIIAYLIWGKNISKVEDIGKNEKFFGMKNFWKIYKIFLNSNFWIFNF